MSYTPESARKEAFEGVKYSIPVESFKKYLVDSNYAENMKYKRLGSVDLGDRSVQYFSDGGYIVTYLKDLHYAFIFSKFGKLDGIQIRSSLTYPYKTYSYTHKGKLDGVIFEPDPYYSYLYEIDGKFVGHWEGDYFYDPNGKLSLQKVKKK